MIRSLTGSGERYCFCGGPSDGSFMLGCDDCDRWFHGECVGRAESTFEGDFVCPECLEKRNVGYVPMPDVSLDAHWKRAEEE